MIPCFLWTCNIPQCKINMFLLWTGAELIPLTATWSAWNNFYGNLTSLLFMTGTGKSQSRNLLQNILVSAKTFSHRTGNFFCPGEEMGDISQGYTVLHVLQLNCQLSPQDRAVIGSVHIRFPSTPLCEHKGWDAAKARKCTAKHSWHEWYNKQKQMCLLTWLHEGGRGKVYFDNNKKINWYLNTGGFAGKERCCQWSSVKQHLQITRHQKWGNGCCGYQTHTTAQINDKSMMSMFKAYSEILLALGLTNPEPFTNLLDGSKFSTTLPHTVCLQMQQVFWPRPKGRNVRN